MVLQFKMFVDLYSDVNRNMLFVYTKRSIWAQEMVVA